MTTRVVNGAKQNRRKITFEDGGMISYLEGGEYDKWAQGIIKERAAKGIGIQETVIFKKD